MDGGLASVPDFKKVAISAYRALPGIEPEERKKHFLQKTFPCQATHALPPARWAYYPGCITDDER
jgi:hypothetical protein